MCLGADVVVGVALYIDDAWWSASTRAGTVRWRTGRTTVARRPRVVALSAASLLAHAGNPLTDPNWATDTTDTLVRLVAAVREQTTTKAVFAAGLVFGIIAVFLGAFILIIAIIGLMRGLQALLDLAVTQAQAVYLSYFIVGGFLYRRLVAVQEAQHRHGLTFTTGVAVRVIPRVDRRADRESHTCPTSARMFRRHHHRIRPCRPDRRDLHRPSQPGSAAHRG